MTPPEAAVRTIEATTHGRYLLSRPGGEGPHPLLVGFHGYGESAEHHLAALRRIPGSSDWLMVAVEALHLFYTRSREVVGCWMTKVNREQAIADNVRYVAGVVETVRREQRPADLLVYAGFSQGVAMAYRAAVAAGERCHGLVVLGGDVPPDVVEGAGRLPPVLVGHGEEDWWYTREKHEADVAALARLSPRVEPLVLKGGHEWGDAFAEAAGDFLSRLATPGPPTRTRRPSRG